MEYITEKDYEEAEKQGICRSTLRTRISMYGWDKEKAIKTPIKNKKEALKYPVEWIKIAEENGIGDNLFRIRVREYGMSYEEAATIPKVRNKKLGYKRVI